ncbi:hypothetical protein GXW71_10375 [Roseomonas hellenica]|uniref:Uncharacterized protein n=1 Tax=Plastoroseomonas hellenica TaxID=2687306 RepID=A0ABS5EWT0_9PROT|nr:hypothetical protein [Plastoroseomonas hellenica]MBR0664756.1 hypothetical protein [Plastoroseomonas hellenica]
MLTVDALDRKHLGEAAGIVAVASDNGNHDELLVWSAVTLRASRDATGTPRSRPLLRVHVASLSANALRPLIDKIAWLGGAAGITDIL